MRPDWQLLRRSWIRAHRCSVEKRQSNIHSLHRNKRNQGNLVFTALLNKKARPISKAREQRWKNLNTKDRKMDKDIRRMKKEGDIKDDQMLSKGWE